MFFKYICSASPKVTSTIARKLNRYMSAPLSPKVSFTQPNRTIPPCTYFSISI